MFRKAIIRTLERTPTAGGLFFTDGLCKKQAMEEADRTGAALYEVRSTERT